MQTVELTDMEYHFYKNDFNNIFDLYQLRKNKDLAFNNDQYKQIVKNIEWTDVYKRLFKENWEKHSEIFNKYWWNSQNNIVTDAIRHSYFNALNAKYFWKHNAKKIWDYHEEYNGNIWGTAVIDLYNNSVWRSIWYKNKDKSDEEILYIILNNFDSLIYWDFNKENWTWKWNKRYNEVIKNLNKDLIR